MQCNLKERASLKSMWLATIVACVISVSFWLAASWSAGVNEPLDAQCYWTVLYPASLALTLTLGLLRSEEHTSELQSLMRISYADFCFKKKHKKPIQQYTTYITPINHDI